MIQFTKIKKELVSDLVGINDPEILTICNYLKHINKKNDCGNECLILANGGNAEAQYVISKILQWGLACSPNEVESVNWCQKSVDNGFVPAYYSLADFNSKSNKHKAIELYLRAALNDYTPALNMLGFIYSSGYLTKKNISKAIQYYEKAIKLGNSKAMYSLSQLFLSEPECLDIEKAMKLLKDSADRDYPDAHFILGNMHWSGDNGLQKSKELYRKHNKMQTIIKNKIVATCLDGLM